MTVIASACITLFGLRFLSALVGVKPWTTAWRVIDMPTGLIINPLSHIPVFDNTIISRLTVADVVAFVVVAGIALVSLASLSLRRAG